MDKTFDILNDKALAVFDDRLPVVFKYNGETLRKLSALTKNVNNSETNVNEVSYTSEYNRSLRSLGVSGNTSQKQYQGYNPLKFKDFSGELVDSKGNILSYEMKDSIMTLNGKYDGFTTLDIPFTQLAIKSPTFKAGTYTYTPYYYRKQGQRISGCDWNLGGYAYSGPTGLATKTFDKNVGYANCSLYISGEYKDYKYAPAIFEGTYASLDELPPYEPYVGGIPSPNPGQKIPIYSTTESTVTLNAELETSEITYDSNFLYTIAFEHPFSFNGAESLTLSVDGFYTGSAGDMLIVGGDPSNIIGGSGTFDYIASGDGSRGEVTIHSSGYGDTFYIGIGNTDTGISSDKIEDYRQLAITTPISATGTITTQTGVREIPAYPQEIENANSEGMSVTLHGDNLFNQELLLTDSNFTKDTYNGEECIKVVANVNAHTFPCEIPIGKMNFSFEIAHPKTGGNFSVNLNYEDGSGEYREYVSNNPKTDFYKFSIAKTTTKKIVKIIITFWNIWNMRPYYIKNFMVNTGDPKPYNPYFREEITIPASVEVDGATVDLNMANVTVDRTSWGGTVRQATDKLVVNKVENKVEYKKEVNRIVFDGTEAFSIFYGSTFQIDVLANADGSQCFCSHFTTNETEETYVEINTGHLRFGTNFETLEDFVAWVKEQYANGTPLTVEYALGRPITYDITNTDLGNLILDLTNKIPYGTIYLEVDSGLSVPITVDYAKWGGDLPEDEE